MSGTKKLRKTPSQQSSRQMFDTILDGTARVLSEQGYARMTTNLVAEVTGVSVGSVYQYFSGKNALVSAVHTRHSQQMQQMAIAVLSKNGEGDLRDCIASVTQCLLAAHADNSKLYRVLEGREASLIITPSRSDGAELRDAFHLLLERNKRRILKADIEFATWFSLRAIHTLVHEAVIGDNQYCEAADVGPAIADSVMGFLAAS